MSIRFTLAVLPILIGCQGSPNPSLEAKADPQVAAYREAVKAYLAEARATTKLLDLKPTRAKMLERHKMLEDMHSQLPAAPPLYANLQDELAELPIHCHFIAESIRFRDGFLSLGAKDKADEAEAGIKKSVEQILAKAATVEAELSR